MSRTLHRDFELSLMLGRRSTDSGTMRYLTEFGLKSMLQGKVADVQDKDRANRWHFSPAAQHFANPAHGGDWVFENKPLLKRTE